MSHIVTIKTEIRDPHALRLACRRNGLREPILGTAKLFNSEATGYQVQLPRWRFPVVCQAETGQVHFDNFNGRWGEQAHLDRLMQSYAVERAAFEARRQGYSVTEQTHEDGSIKLCVEIGGAT